MEGILLLIIIIILICILAILGTSIILKIASFIADLIFKTIKELAKGIGYVFSKEKKTNNNSESILYDKDAINKSFIKGIIVGSSILILITLILTS